MGLLIALSLPWLAWSAGWAALAGAAFAALTFWRNKQSDDEFLDEELD